MRRITMIYSKCAKRDKNKQTKCLINIGPMNNKVNF